MAKMRRNSQQGVESLSRRRLLARLGAFAAYTAPAMTTLLVHSEARANHRPGHVVQGLDECQLNPDLPQCRTTCEQNPNLPGCDPCESPTPPPTCEVGSLGASPEAQSFEPAEGWGSLADDAPSSGDWGS